MKIFDYEDIQLIPSRCIVNSRKECDTSVKLGGYTFKLPVVPANMKTVIDERLAIWLAENGYFYVMHRFDTDNIKFTKLMHSKKLFASIAIGIKQLDYNLIVEMSKQKISPEFITIDIAHGHSLRVKTMIEQIKKYLPKSFIIAGNIATPEAVKDLENWGADATKIGIGPGKVCITKLKTGYGTGGWQLSALKWCSKASRKPIIADGGLRYNGDIAKSIRFGATMAMIGSMLAGHEESPGETIKKDNKLYKEYYGSASEFNKSSNENIEGKKILIPHKGRIENTLKEMQQDLQSSISYAGGNTIDAIKTSNYVIVKNSILNNEYQ